MIMEDAEALSLKEGRRVDGPGHQAAVEFIEQRMAEIGLQFHENDSYRFPYSFDGRRFTNLAGIVPGDGTEALPVLLAAHYDGALDGPCTDDNAVSVAVILSIAEKLIGLENRRQMIIAFFDAEERPFFGTDGMGSIRFCRDDCRGLEFAAVVILDAIGHDFELMVPVLDRTIRRIREFIFVAGAESHTLFPGIVEEAARKVSHGLRVIPTLNRYIGDSSDYMAFRKAGEPWLFISRGNGRHTHTLGDDMGWVNFTAVEKVKELVLHLLKGIDRSPMEDGRGETETFALEKRMLERAAGPLLPLALPLLGIWKTSLRTRADMDALSAALNRHLRPHRDTGSE